jgi:3-carboxy-cis,cis-muconate cycloisomerase
MEEPMAQPVVPTATTVLDSILFRDAFGTPRMREVFSDYALISRYVEVEIALARAEAWCGVIPTEAAEEIAAKCNVAALDFDLLRQETDIVGYPILPLVHQLVKQCGEAGRYVHWGATTQDILDTALALQMRDGFDQIERSLAAIGRGLAAKAVEHRDDAMAGRTYLQQALPVTFGYKCAVLAAPLIDHAARLAQVRARVLRVQLGGAVGTLASLGDRGQQVVELLAEEVGLGVPVVPWHTFRLPILEVAAAKLAGGNR